MRSKTFSGNIEKVAYSLDVAIEVSLSSDASANGSFACGASLDVPAKLESVAEDVVQPDGGLVPAMGSMAIRLFFSVISVILSNWNDEGDVGICGGGTS